MEHVFVGRQPIYNRRLEVVAYELLYRDGGTRNQADIRDGDRATSEVIINSFMEIGLDAIVERKPAFINLTRGFILGEPPLPLPRQQVVLEVLEDIRADEPVLAALQGLAERGYTIALDDFEYRRDLEPLLELAHIVKVEVDGRTPEALAAIVRRLRRFDVRLLAEKVETHEEFAACRALGFDLFQGYFLCRPSIHNGVRPSANRLVLLSLLARLQKPDISMKELEEVVVQDAPLTYRLLRYINSAYFYLRSRIDSVRRALIILGVQRIKSWSSLILLSSIEEKPRALIVAALIRAKMCELLAPEPEGSGREPYFTAGLFSLLDALLDQPLETLLRNLPLTDELREALLAQRGPMGRTLRRVIDYEQARWGRLAADRVNVGAYRRAYLEAVDWAQQTSSTVLGQEQPRPSARIA